MEISDRGSLPARQRKYFDHFPEAVDLFGLPAMDLSAPKALAPAKPLA